jgi:predicted AAA+ superfamily ATPase
MIPRTLAPNPAPPCPKFPVVAITGPRQSGKTTLARAVFADKPYVSLEDPIERAFAMEDPRGFLARFEKGALFDEAQRWPDLFSYLQGMVDGERAPGRFVLTGSQQFGLLAGVTQSLAGRVGLTRLLPLTFAEMPSATRQLTIDAMLLLGGYPLLHSQPIMASDWFASYVATYVERDVRQVLNVQDLGGFPALPALVRRPQRTIAQPECAGRRSRHFAQHRTCLAFRPRIE